MGLPKINIEFKTMGASAIKRGERGIVALILKDGTNNGFREILTAMDIPSDLSQENKDAIAFALIGGMKPPAKVIVYIQPAASEDYTEAEAFLETVKWDYLAVPDITDADRADIAAWVKSLRDTMDKKVKVVLPNHPGDHEGIINFTTTQIKSSSGTYTTKQYCPRIAGLLAGTPLTISATFQALPEVVDVSPRLTGPQLNSAIDAGRFEIFHDGEKVKVARAVNSLQTTTAEKGDVFKKIKIVDILDLIHDDIKRTAENNYIGKFANSYDNKCLLITAIQAYYEQLETDGILDRSFDNIVGIDEVAQRNYLLSKGINVSQMTEQEVKEANTGDKVFLASSIKPLDAIEDISLGIMI